MQRSEAHVALAGGSVPQRVAYPAPEVAVLLGGVTLRYVRKLIATGELDSFKIGNRRLVTRESIDTFVAQLREDELRARAASVA